MPAQIRGIQNQKDGVWYADLGHLPTQQVVRDPLVLGPGSQAVRAREVQKLQFFPIGKAYRSMMPLHGDARKVGRLLAESRKPVEESGLSAVWRAYESNRRTFGH
jgi:hypothetical protein